MIAKYDGKCQLTRQPIIAGKTQIERFAGSFLLAEYATTEAVQNYFAERIAEIVGMAAEIAELRGRDAEKARAYWQEQCDAINPFVNRGISFRFATDRLHFEAEQMQSSLERVRNRAHS